MYSAQAILAALFARQRSGQGRHVQMALYDCGVMITSYYGMEALLKDGDLLGGQIGIMFADVVAALPHIHAGKLKAIALSSPNAKALLPKTRTVSEQGFPGFDFDSWGGLIAPLGTPQAILDRIASETRDIVAKDKELQQKLLTAGAIASFQDGKQMQARLNKDYERWSAIVKAKGISAT